MSTDPSQSSNYSLSKVRDALDKRFPNTGVRVNCPAVAVPFGSSKSESTEVVPADYMGEKNGFFLYDIADCSDGWMKASPDAHNAYVRTIDNKLDDKVKPLIRFIKAWKYYRQVPISSFYLELRVAKYANNETSIIYDIDVKQVLCWLRDIELADMQDPMGISGYISPCKTQAKYDDAISKLKIAATRAEKAREAEKNGNTKEAFEWWQLVYDNQFPSYYR